MQILAPSSQEDDDDGDDDDAAGIGDQEFTDALEGNRDIRDTKPELNRLEGQRRRRNWRKRVERTLVKMTTEMAAVREGIESQKAFERRRRKSAWAWTKWFIWAAAKHLVIDAVVLAMIMIWMRWRNVRLEQAKRVIREQMDRLWIRLGI